MLRRHKKFSIVTLLLLVFIAFLFISTIEKKTALEQTQSFCLESIKGFQSQLDSFQYLAENKSDRKILIQQFKNCRVYFKRFEFISEYYDNARYPFFNGANAVEMEYGYNPNSKPEGLQVIEEELFKDSLDLNRIIFLTKQLKYRALFFYIILKDATLKDAFIFEAIRFHFIRIETLSLVSFDSPTIRNNVEEIISGLKSIQTILKFYNYSEDAKNTKSLFDKLKITIQYLNGKSFENLDRLEFIKHYIQPLVVHYMNFQQRIKIPFSVESHAPNKVVKLSTSSIYDTDFINTKFFAQDNKITDNPLQAALGKQLFFEKKLSADGKMSCATCHQPNNFFIDNLSKSVTNKPDEFQLRNTTSLLNVAFQSSFFYDFKATALENQIDRVVENPLEFNHQYDAILSYLKSDSNYIRLFSAAFPEIKNEPVSVRTLRKSIAAYERKMVFLNSPFDKYMRGENSKLPASVKRGFNLFMGKAQCGSCHFAPTYFGLAPPFYNISESEVLGVTKTFDTIHPVLDDDIGRYKIDAFDFLKHAMKTSTVRNAEFTAPYMHHGGFKTLEDVIEFYNVGGGKGMGLDVSNQTLNSARLLLSVNDKKDIISFIKALSDTSGISNLQ